MTVKAVGAFVSVVYVHLNTPPEVTTEGVTAVRAVQLPESARPVPGFELWVSGFRFRVSNSRVHGSGFRRGRYRGGLVFKAHRLCVSGLRVIKREIRYRAGRRRGPRRRARG